MEEKIITNVNYIFENAHHTYEIAVCIIVYVVLLLIWGVAGRSIIQTEKKDKVYYFQSKSSQSNFYLNFNFYFKIALIDIICVLL